MARITGVGSVAVRGDTSDASWRIDIPVSSVSDHFDLPATEIGSSSSATSDVFVRNRSAAELYVESLTITGEHASEFEIVTGQAPFLLVENQRWSVGFKFTPAGAGLRVADVVTAARDADTVKTQLRGIGLETTTDVPETGSGITLASDMEYLQTQPNPAQGEALIRYNMLESTHVRFTVHSVVGEVVDILQDGPAEPGTYGIRVDVSMLSAGTYFVVLRAGNRVRSERLIVE